MTKRSISWEGIRSFYNTIVFPVLFVTFIYIRHNYPITAYSIMLAHILVFSFLDIKVSKWTIWLVLRLGWYSFLVGLIVNEITYLLTHG